MPQRKAAKKALRQNKKRRQKNLQVKKNVKVAIKKLKKAAEAKDASTGQKALAEAYKSLDKAVTKKIIHRNKAAKRKSRLSKLLKKATPKTSS